MTIVLVTRTTAIQECNSEFGKYICAGEGAGDDRGGGGGSAPPPKHTNEDMPDLSSVNSDKLFDDKIVLSDSYPSDGVKSGEAWRKKVRGYCISNLPWAKTILDYPESMGSEEVTNEMLVDEARTCRWMTEVNVRSLSEVIWGSLDTGHRRNAKDQLRAADELFGFDAWRRVIQHIWQDSNARQGLLRESVGNTPATTSLEGAAAGATRSESIMGAYEGAGGSPSVGQEPKNDFMHASLELCRGHFSHRFTAANEPFSSCLGRARATTQPILFHRGGYPSLNAMGSSPSMNGATRGATTRQRSTPSTVDGAHAVVRGLTVEVAVAGANVEARASLGP